VHSNGNMYFQTNQTCSRALTGVPLFIPRRTRSRKPTR
jgi:hypothetical protein